jgi:hypothetical protein
MKYFLALILKTVLNLLNLEIFYLIICKIFLEINNQYLGDDFVEVKKVREEKAERADEEEKLKEAK